MDTEIANYMVNWKQIIFIESLVLKSKSCTSNTYDACIIKANASVDMLPEKYSNSEKTKLESEKIGSSNPFWTNEAFRDLISKILSACA